MQGKGLDPIEQALRQKQVNDAKRAFEQSLETIKGATMWYNRDGALVSKWLSKQSFK
jgi:hypothetical protein